MPQSFASTYTDLLGYERQETWGERQSSAPDLIAMDSILRLQAAMSDAMFSRKHTSFLRFPCPNP